MNVDATTSEARSVTAERLVVLTVALATMLVPLNSTMIAVALPELMDEFNVGLVRAGWLITAYLITMASLQPVAGKIGDRVGRRRFLIGGLMLFGLASVAAGLAPNLWVLLSFRVLQAVAGALIVPNGAALILDAVPEERRGARFGLIGAAVALGAALGPLLGGVLIEAASWRAIFYINLLLVVPALAIGWRWLPSGVAEATRSQFDVTGAFMLLLVLVGTAGLLMSIARGSSWLVGVPVVIGIAAVFLWWEFKHPDPVFQPRLFRRRAFAAANGGIGLGNLAMYTLLLSVPLLLASRSESSSLLSGFVLTAMAGAMIIISPFGGQLADKFGRRLPTAVGLALLTIGAVPMAVAGAEVTMPVLIVGLAFVGLGIGLSTPGLQTSSVESVREEEAGVASGIYSTSRYLGSIVGSAILAGLVQSSESGINGVGTVFVIVLAAALLATFTSFGLRARPAAYRAV